MHILEIKNVTISVDKADIIHGVSFCVKEGELHVLMGPNGSGKSTIAGALMGMSRYTFTTGEVLIDGEDISAFPTHMRARKGLFLSLQYLPEIAGVSLRQFLHKAYIYTTGETISPKDFYVYAQTCAEMVGIPTSLLDRDLNTKLSGGEKKQSEMLQLLVLKPKFAILDEIDSGLDIDSSKKILAGIDILRKQKTGFLMITHYPHILEQIKPTALHIIKEGRIVISGNSELATQVLNDGFENI